MKTIIPRNLLESLGIEIPETSEGLVVELSQVDYKVTGVSWVNLPSTFGECFRNEDSTRRLYGNLLRVADFYRSLEGGIEARLYGFNFGNLDAPDDSWKKEGRLCDPDFAFSYPGTRDTFYKNFKEGLIRISGLIKSQYK